VLDADGKHPRVKARLQGIVWKGKTFHDDGTFTNAGSAAVNASPPTLAWSRVGSTASPVSRCSTRERCGFRQTSATSFRQIAPDVWLRPQLRRRHRHAKNWFVLRAK